MQVLLKQGLFKYISLTNIPLQLKMFENQTDLINILMQKKKTSTQTHLYTHVKQN